MIGKMIQNFNCATASLPAVHSQAFHPSHPDWLFHIFRPPTDYLMERRWSGMSLHGSSLSYTDGNWSLSHSGRADRNLNMLFSMTSFQACGKIACIIHTAASPFPSPPFISKDNFCRPRRFHHHFFILFTDSFSSSVDAFFSLTPIFIFFFHKPTL